jgi:hypothetical protein
VSGTCETVAKEMTRKVQPLWIAAAGVTIAVALRWLLPRSTGVTVYLPAQTRYIAANVLGFWFALSIAVAVALLAWPKKA